MGQKSILIIILISLKADSIYPRKKYIFNIYNLNRTQWQINLSSARKPNLPSTTWPKNKSGWAFQWIQRTCFPRSKWGKNCYAPSVKPSLSNLWSASSARAISIKPVSTSSAGKPTHVLCNARNLSLYLWKRTLWKNYRIWSSHALIKNSGVIKCCPTTKCSIMTKCASTRWSSAKPTRTARPNASART